MKTKETEVGCKLSDFEIIKQLGRGSYGTVYTVKSLINSNIYVMKKMELNHLKESQQKECYREVSILRKVSHPNIIKYYSSFLENESLCIIMEYAELGDLYSLIKHYKRHQKYFEELVLWRISYEILNGLEYLHNNNIIHRDIKCLNLFLSKDHHVKIGDLGVSTISSIGNMHCTRVGTPLYLSPELIKQIPYDYKTDIWSFGCSLYHLASLEPPFTGNNLIVLGNNIVKNKPKELSDRYSMKFKMFVDKMLTKRPDKRPSAKEAKEMIPKDYMEKIFLAEKNKVEIKNRPFSSIGNRVVNNDNNNKKSDDKNEGGNNKNVGKSKVENNFINDKKSESNKIIEEKNKNNDVKKDEIKVNIENNVNSIIVKEEKISKNDEEQKDKNMLSNDLKQNNQNNNKVNNIFINNYSNINSKKSGSFFGALANQKCFNFFRNINNMNNNNLNNENIIRRDFKFVSRHNMINSNNKIVNNSINLKNNSNSIKVYSSELKKELMDLQKNETDKKIIKKDNKNRNLDNNANLNMKKSRTDSNSKMIFPLQKNNANNNLSNSQNNLLLHSGINKNKITDKTDILFPNLKLNNVPSNTNINTNENITTNKKLLLGKRNNFMNEKKKRPFSSRPFIVNNNSLKKNRNTAQNSLNAAHYKVNSNRPKTGFKQVFNNNITNVNINFFNIDMNKRFLDPETNPCGINNKNDDIIFNVEQNANLNDLKNIINSSNGGVFVNFKDLKGKNNTNEFIFQKVIKALQDNSNQKKLTINDLQ